MKKGSQLDLDQIIMLNDELDKIEDHIGDMTKDIIFDDDALEFRRWLPLQDVRVENQTYTEKFKITTMCQERWTWQSCYKSI